MGDVGIEGIGGKTSRDWTHDEVTRRVGLYGELPYLAYPVRTAANRRPNRSERPGSRTEDL